MEWEEEGLAAAAAAAAAAADVGEGTGCETLKPCIVGGRLRVESGPVGLREDEVDDDDDADADDAADDVVLLFALVLNVNADACCEDATEFGRAALRPVTGAALLFELLLLLLLFVCDDVDEFALLCECVVAVDDDAAAALRLVFAPSAGNFFDPSMDDSLSLLVSC